MCTPMSEVIAALSYGATEMQDGARGAGAARDRPDRSGCKRPRLTQLTPSPLRVPRPEAPICAVLRVVLARVAAQQK